MRILHGTGFLCSTFAEHSTCKYPHHLNLQGYKTAADVVCAVELFSAQLGGSQTDQHVRLDAITIDIALLNIPPCA